MGVAAVRVKGVGKLPTPVYGFPSSTLVFKEYSSRENKIADLQCRIGKFGFRVLRLEALAT